MTYQEQVDNLVKDIQEILELDDLEAKVYLNLLRIGPITASNLAKKLEIDRARMYRLVEKLTNKNIISTTMQIPKLCIAVDPTEALKNAIRKKQNEISNIKKSGEILVEKIKNQIPLHPSNAYSIFQIIQNKQNTYASIEQIIEETSDITYIVTTMEDASKMYYSTIPEKITSAKKNGGNIRLLIYNYDSNLNSYIKRFNATETRICKIPIFGRIVVNKNNKVMLTDNYSSNHQNDYSLYTNSPDLVGNMFSLCSLLWETAQPIKTLYIKNYSQIKDL